MTEQAAIAGPSAGTLLRQAREAAGLHVAALAVSLKVPVRKLEALEEDRYDVLPDAVFARALASSVCRTLKVDPQPVLERLPQGPAPRLIQAHEGINAPFRAPGDVVVPAWREHLTRPVSLAVGALLIGALVIVFLPTTRRDDAAAGAPKAEVVAAPMAAPVLLQPTPAASEPVGAPSGPEAATAIPSAATASAAPPAPPMASSGVQATVAATPVPAASSPAPVAAGPVSGLVVFRTTGASWVEVVDSQGQVALRRLLGPGESAGASGTLPLSVTVGSASTTSVEVRGKRFDLAPLARDNVARFEVK